MTPEELLALMRAWHIASDVSNQDRLMDQLRMHSRDEEAK